MTHFNENVFFSYCIKPFPAVDERLWSYLQRHVNPLAFSVQAPRVCLFNIVWSLPLISLLSLIVSWLFADWFCCGQHLILNRAQEPNHNDHLQNYHHPHHDQVNRTYWSSILFDRCRHVANTLLAFSATTISTVSGGGRANATEQGADNLTAKCSLFSKNQTNYDNRHIQR